eukprot:2174492-Amphidinium_carterae.1
MPPTRATCICCQSDDSSGNCSVVEFHDSSKTHFGERCSWPMSLESDKGFRGIVRRSMSVTCTLHCRCYCPAKHPWINSTSIAPQGRIDRI